MKDVFIHPRGLGLRGVVQRIKKCNHFVVVDVFIIRQKKTPVKGSVTLKVLGAFI